MDESDLDEITPCMAVSRPDMVESARKFMSNPKIRQTPIEEQKQFLLGKGVTEAEIEEAIKSLPPPPPLLSESPSAALAHYETGLQNNYPGTSRSYQSSSSGDRFLQFTNRLLVLGGISYASYRFIRSVVLPRFFNVPDPMAEEQRKLQNQMFELQNSMKFVVDSVVQTLQTVNEQQRQLKALLSMSSRDVNDRDVLQSLQNDISIVKSLLLNQNQFAAIPNNIGKQSATAAANATSQIPAWQQPRNVTHSSPTLSNGFHTPPVAVSPLIEETRSDDSEVEQTLSSESAGSSV